MKRYAVLLVTLIVAGCTASILAAKPTEPATPTRLPAGTPAATYTLSDGVGTETVTSTVASQQGQSQVYYVATGGDDDNSGTEGQPFRTIGRGIRALGPGDALYVKSGTYAEALCNFPSGTSWAAPVTIAAYPGDLVVIRPSWAYVAYFAYCHHVMLDGFVLDGANVTHTVVLINEEAHHIRIQNSEVVGAPRSGILVSNYGSVDSDHNEFVNLDVHDNGTTDFDHGIYLKTSNNLVDHCLIHHNAGWGVHIYNDHHPDESANNNVVSNNVIYDNAAAGDRGPGIVLSSGSGNLAYNNLIWGNDAGIQIAYGVSDAKAYNNVIYANDRYGIYVYPDSVNAIVRNNIICQNTGTAVIDMGSDTMQDHNLIETDPKFVDASAHDFHLQPTSPAIDAGVALREVPDDFDGVLRPRGAGYDIGACESPFSTQVTDLRVVAAVSETPNPTLTLRWTAPIAAVTYTLRSSDTLLTTANWDEAPTIAVPFTASEPGSSEWLTTSVDYAGGTLYLALKSQNSAGIWSELSNNAFWPRMDVHLPLIGKDYVSSSQNSRLTLHLQRLGQNQTCQPKPSF
jgi:hypothetical protein